MLPLEDSLLRNFLVLGTITIVHFMRKVKGFLGKVELEGVVEKCLCFEGVRW